MAYSLQTPLNKCAIGAQLILEASGGGASVPTHGFLKLQKVPRVDRVFHGMMVLAKETMPVMAVIQKRREDGRSVLLVYDKDSNVPFVRFYPQTKVLETGRNVKERSGYLLGRVLAPKKMLNTNDRIVVNLVSGFELLSLPAKSSGEVKEMMAVAEMAR